MNKKDVQQSINEEKELREKTSSGKDLKLNQIVESAESSDIDNLKSYDDTVNSNVDEDDPIAISNDQINENSLNERPTFTRTYDKNEAEEIHPKDSGKFDGEIGI